MWQLHAEERRPGDIDAQVQEILAQLTDDLRIWKQLAESYVMDVFCGAFMKRTNDGIIFLPDTLFRLGSRGIELNLDIYGPAEDEESEPES